MINLPPQFLIELDCCQVFLFLCTIISNAMSQPSAFKHITGFAAESSDYSVFIHEITLFFLNDLVFYGNGAFFFYPTQYLSEYYI